jgi:FXSXX-COOH protein
MSTMDELVSPSPDADVPSVLPNLDRIALGEMIASAAVLRESVNRVLPALEIQQVSVAAFNSTI